MLYSRRQRWRDRRAAGAGNQDDLPPPRAPSLVGGTPDRNGFVSAGSEWAAPCARLPARWVLISTTHQSRSSTSVVVSVGRAGTGDDRSAARMSRQSLWSGVSSIFGDVRRQRSGATGGLPGLALRCRLGRVGHASHRRPADPVAGRVRQNGPSRGRLLTRCHSTPRQPADHRAWSVTTATAESSSATRGRRGKSLCELSPGRIPRAPVRKSRRRGATRGRAASPGPSRARPGGLRQAESTRAGSARAGSYDPPWLSG